MSWGLYCFWGLRFGALGFRNLGFLVFRVVGLQGS